MYPQVGYSGDPVEGLEEQLTELIGLIKIVPRLIDADRGRRWEDIYERSGEGELYPTPLDAYEGEAGPEEGWGHADYSYTIQASAVVTAWSAFHEYLVRQLFESCLHHDLSGQPALARLVEDERRKLDRRFDDVERRYTDFAKLNLKVLSKWNSITHAHQLRNALVHNSGQYTHAYLNTKLAQRPTSNDLLGLTPPPESDADLINRLAIPLSPKFTEQVISGLIEAAKKIRDALASSPPTD